MLHEFHNLVEYGAESVYSEYPVLDIGQSDPSFLIIFKILGLTSSTTTTLFLYFYVFYMDGKVANFLPGTSALASVF